MKYICCIKYINAFSGEQRNACPCIQYARCLKVKETLEIYSFAENDAPAHKESIYHTQLRTTYVKIGEGSNPRTGDSITAVCITDVSADIDLELAAFIEGHVGFLRCVKDYTFELLLIQSKIIFRSTIHNKIGCDEINLTEKRLHDISVGKYLNIFTHRRLRF